MSPTPAALSDRRGRTFSAWHCLVAAAALVCAIASCNRQGAKEGVAAKVGDSTIFAGDVEKRINHLDGFTRHKYQSAAGKQEYVDGLIRLELLAQEAKSRGYDRDPDFLQTMNRELASRLLQEEVVSKSSRRPIPASAVEEYYKSHLSEFTQPRQVRVLQILVSNQGLADQAAAEARQLKPEDDTGFRTLVTRLSEGKAAGANGGEPLTIDKNTTGLPKAAVDLILGLGTVGAIAGPVHLGGRYGVYRAVEISEGFVRALGQVDSRIRQQMSKDATTRDVDALMQKLRERIPVKKYNANIDRMVIQPGYASDTSPAPSPARPDAENKLEAPAGIQGPLGDKPESPHASSMAQGQ